MRAGEGPSPRQRAGSASAMDGPGGRQEEDRLPGKGPVDRLRQLCWGQLCHGLSSTRGTPGLALTGVGNV